MNRNMGTADRVVRLVLAVAAIVGGIAAGSGSALGIVLFVVAAVFVVTSLVGFCPLYRLVGINTCAGKD
jgi:hypothetical protein